MEDLKKKQRQLVVTSRSLEYPRAAMLWIGEVEDAKSIDELITSA